MMRLSVPGVERLSQASQLDYSFSGTGVNVSSQLARFGHEANLVSRLPDNPLGEAAESQLRKLGIGTAYLARGGKYIGMYFFEKGSGAPGARNVYGSARKQLQYRSGRCVSVCRYRERDRRRSFLRHCLGDERWRPPPYEGIGSRVKAAGGLVIFDCNYRPAHWGEGGHVKAKPHYEEMLQLADIVMMNEKDAMLTLNMKSGKTGRREQAEELIPQVAKQYHISVIAGTHRTIVDSQTHSLQGFLYKRDSFYYSEPLTFAVHDRIGAGDAYTCGIMHGEFRGFPPEQTVRFAAASSMLAHTIEGDTPMAAEQK